MMRPLSILSALLVLSAPLRAQQPSVPKELAPLQGRWQLTSVNGEMVDASTTAVFIVTGEGYLQGENGKVSERGTLRVDPAKKPMTIDFIITAGKYQNMTQLGIFEINGDTIRVQVNQPGAKERPTDFALRDGYDLVIAKKSPK
jgi:uncharacterized protein (TIGR03067 family)